MDESKEEREERTVVERAVDTALLPFHAATSKPARKAYLGTFIFAATSLFLFALSSLAYILFYYNYVPQNSVERVIHLQFGDGMPYGTSALSSALTSLQPYDISLFLHLPRTPNNLRAGNFMLDLLLLAPEDTPSSIASTIYGNTSTSILAQSRRPAILTYVSPIVDTANTLSGLPWHVLGWKKESEVLEISMFEGVEFAKGWANVPQSVKVVVEADEKMQFYEVGVRMIARFGGLRWILYHHRIVAFLFFTTTFWSCSMLSMLFVWFIVSSYFSTTPTPIKTESEAKENAIKRERSDSDTFDPTSVEDLSDTSRTFPTLGRQLPLHFSGRSGVKIEDEEDMKKEEILRSTDIQPLVTEADDEGEDGTEWRDSGIGTGRDEERLASVQRRRKALLGSGALGGR
ncbi:CCR4-NOT core subunit cdc39 [Lecanora helva]